MLGRWFYLAVVGIGLYAYVQAPGSGAADGGVEQTCAAPDAPAAAVTVGWPEVPAGAAQLWLDLSLGEGFPPGGYSSNGPIAPDQRRATYDLPVGLAYHYRVTALYAEGWRLVTKGAFTTACPAGSSQSSVSSGQ
ncbi:MAG: hypothetical protein WEC75_07955 [Dehalococcoidia bacterium]